MSRAHLPGLHIEEDGTVIVDSAADWPDFWLVGRQISQANLIRFEDREWRVANEWQRRTISSFLQSAYEEVCSTGRLPHPPDRATSDWHSCRSAGRGREAKP